MSAGQELAGALRAGIDTIGAFLLAPALLAICAAAALAIIAVAIARLK